MADLSQAARGRIERPKRAGPRGWHYVPNLPLEVSPLFSWPLDPVKAVKWLWKSWFLLTERLVLVGLAFLSWLYTQPALERCVAFEADWLAQIYLRNLALFILVAGGLHLYFYSFKRQGDALKFDKRDLARNNRVFTLRNQVWDNIIWSLASGVTVWTAYEALMMWAMANGYVPTLNWSENPICFVLLFALVPLWESFYFYLIHRMIHFPFLYRHIHYLHHRNVNVGPWSGLAMHPIEHVIYLGSVLIHFVVPAHPVHILYHLQYFTLTAATTHAGFAGFSVAGRNRFALGTFHHQMHHRYFECNYGGLEVPWDKWFGSFHDGTAESHERFLERRRRMTRAT